MDLLVIGHFGDGVLMTKWKCRALLTDPSTDTEVGVSLDAFDRPDSDGKTETRLLQLREEAWVGELRKQARSEESAVLALLHASAAAKAESVLFFDPRRGYSHT